MLSLLQCEGHRVRGRAGGMLLALALGLSVAACEDSAVDVQTQPGAMQPTVGDGTANQGIPPGPGVATDGTMPGAPGAGQPVAGTATPAAVPGAGVVPPTGAPTVPTAPTPTPGMEGTAVPPAGMPAGNAWTMIGYDVRSTYYNAKETVLTKENAANLKVAYRVDMGTNVYGVPIQVDGKIYASVSGTAQGLERTVALDAATGDELWRNTDYGTTGSMAYDGGMLYIHTILGKLVALNAADGSKVFEEPTNSDPSDGAASPIVLGDHVYLGGSKGEFTAGNAFRGFVGKYTKTDGKQVALTYTVPEGAHGANIWSSLALDPAAGLVIASTGNNHGPPATDTSDAFLAYKTEDLAEVWKQQAVADDTWSLSPTDLAKPDADFGANPMLYDTMLDGAMTSMVAAGAKSGSIHAARLDDGTLIWERNLCPQSTPDGTTGIFVNTTWGGSAVVAACNTRTAATLFGLDPASGEIQWMTQLPGLVMGRISAANGVGFVGAGADMVIFDTDTGAVLQMVPSQGGATVTGTVSIVDGRVAYGEGMGWSGGIVPGTTLTVLTLE